MSEQAKPSLIDNIFITFTDLPGYSGNLLEKISDHLPNFFIAEKLNVNIEQQQKPTMRDVAKFDSKKLAKEIDDLNLEEKIINYSETNEKYDFFHKNIMECNKKQCPNQRAHKKGNEKDKETLGHKRNIEINYDKKYSAKAILIYLYTSGLYTYDTRHIGTK